MSNRPDNNPKNPSLNKHDDHDHDDEVKQLQADAMAELQKVLAKAEAKKDPLRTERKLLLRELHKTRLRKKLTQAELASRVGVKQPNISSIENGRGNPGLNTLLAIAKALDVNLVLE